MQILYLSSDNLVRVDLLKNENTGQYVSDATVTMTLRDSDLAAVTDAEDLSLSYVSGSNGRYHGTLPDSLSLTAGARYYLDVTAIASGLQAFDRVSLRAQYAGGN